MSSYSLFEFKRSTMRIFLTPCMITLLLTSQVVLAQEQDSLEVDQTANQVEQKLDDVAEYVERNAEFGIKAGLSFSSLNSTEAFGADPKTGLHLGVFGRYLWSDRLSGKVEVLYNIMGARSDRFYIFEDYSLNLNYLTLIASGEIEITQGLRLELGPYLGVLVSSRQSFSDANIDAVREGEDRAESSDTNFVDVGLMAGATYTFDSGFGLAARYQQGFTEALGNDFFRGASGSNTAFQLSTIYTF